MQAKKNLRTAIQAQRNAIPPTQKVAYDTQINKSLWELIQERKYKTIHLYLPMGSEIDLYPLIQKLLNQKIKVYSPKTLKNRKLEHLEVHSLEALEKGLWGTRHPKNSKAYEGTFDLIVVPGLAFDKDCNRLGYGGGYYDNFLKQHKAAHQVAIAYPFQVIEQVPVEAHDEKVGAVLYGELDSVDSFTQLKLLGTTL
ncbi:MAG: 5-formyltetrahydrofolate cyclo-ligase (EC [uncultured Aureispira sp.]|uniref:5-formyltetrahydrofolate cyclo-ligase n=1 Tax=uncultured Aureispira sp. TaxID=1331704 RepID=A0A6S6UDQ1_9BACT|nr:MAG: 5-formyltetrahydrofolate cyclo-ligase (EC [uncultured Aureispira sp.]